MKAGLPSVWTWPEAIPATLRSTVFTTVDGLYFWRAYLRKDWIKEMATAPKAPIPIHEIENVLAFRTKPGAESVKAGETKELGMVDVSQFDKIRLVCDERIGSTCNVLVRLTITEGNELVALLDQILLAPHSQNTRVYDVPGTKLTVSMDGIGPAGTQGAADVLIYGQY
jgi:hypothetical protein